MIARNFITQNIELYKANAGEFHQVFGVPLKSFWDNLTGFDVVKFDDEVIKPDDGTSTRDAIQAKYGEGAVALVVKLLG